MSKSRIFQRTAAAALMLSALPAQARDFSNLYFFGDSLSDVGAFAAVAPGASRFTNNPGTIWADNLAASYGKTATSTYALDPGTGAFTANTSGNDFAVGGAMVNSASVAHSPPISLQVSALLARGALDPNALYSVWAGANDIFAQMTAVGGGASPAAAQRAVSTAATDLAAQVSRLKAAGARNIIVVNMPNLAATPEAMASGPAAAALANALSTTYNSALAQTLAGDGVLLFDASKLFQHVLANPSAYGITNTTTPICAGPSLGCIASANGRFFADGVHPSTLGHKIIADWVYGSLQASQQIAALTVLPLGRSGAQWRLVETQLRDFQNFGATGTRLFGGGDYAPGRLDAGDTSPAASGSTRSLSLGVQRALDAQTLVGALLGYEDAPFDLGDNAGKVSYTAWTVSGFAGYKHGPWYVNGLLSYGWLAYASDRHVTLGPLSTTESGSTRGDQAGAKIQLGYNFAHGGIVHGPFAGADWERVQVNAFSESSGSATAMSYGEQARIALRSRFGYQASGEATWAGLRVRPYGQLSYEYQGRKDERSYTVGFAGSASMISLPTANATGGYGMASAGVSAQVSSDMTVGVGLMSTFSQPGARNSALQISISSAFR